jgi:GTP-binding protein HflX
MGIEFDEKKEQELAILVGVATPKIRPRVAQEHLNELERLVETAGAKVESRVLQKLSRLNPSTLVGKGKIEEIRQLCQIHNISLVVFDEDLSASQARNIERELRDVKIMDRSGIILDIFAKHARTAESRIMVEIAQLNYMLPRLTRAWTHLSRQVGGIGTRGPGETQLEVDRRLVRNRITELKKKLKKIEKARQAQADRRNSTFHVAVVGYTNAGKSTLTNRMTNAGVLEEDKLFATLDSTTRRLFLAPEKELILSDTVGFIRKLPHHLVASFRSTLSVVDQADMILQMVDSSAVDFEDHLEVTNEVLQELVWEDVPRMLAFNKMDLLDITQQQALKDKYPESIFLSATEKIGLELLKEKLLQELSRWEVQRNVN